MLKINNALAHYGDMLAIPGFFLTFMYFARIPNRTLLETVLMLFMLIAFICDILFTIIYLQTAKK
jgi:hypothetical protein